MQLAFDFVCNSNKFILRRFGPTPNALQQIFQVGRSHNEIISRGRLFNRYGESLDPLFPNASTCSPSRFRTIQNNSTVSNTSEIEVAAAAP